MYERLKKEMAKEGINTHALALQLKISPNNLYKCMKGESVFHPAYRKKVARFFNKPEEYFFQGINQL